MVHLSSLKTEQNCCCPHFKKLGTLGWPIMTMAYWFSANEQKSVVTQINPNFERWMFNSMISKMIHTCLQEPQGRDRREGRLWPRESIPWRQSPSCCRRWRDTPSSGRHAVRSGWQTELGDPPHAILPNVALRNSTRQRICGEHERCKILSQKLPAVRKHGKWTEKYHGQQVTSRRVKSMNNSQKY